MDGGRETETSSLCTSLGAADHFRSHMIKRVELGRYEILRRNQRGARCGKKLDKAETSLALRPASTSRLAKTCV